MGMPAEQVTAEVPLDERALGFQTARYEILMAAAGRWPAPEGAPDNVGEMLRISRALFAHGAFVWEFFAVASAWSIIAVELALRDVMEAGASVPFSKLIDRAETDGQLPAREAEVLRAGAGLRNRWFHGEGPLAITPGMAENIVAASQAVVARLYAN